MESVEEERMKKQGEGMGVLSVKLKPMLAHDLPIRLIEHLYYHSGIYGLSPGRKKAKKRGVPRIVELLKRWKRLEDIIDFQLQTLFLSMRAFELGRLFSAMADCEDGVSYMQMDCEIPKKLNKIVGYPDVVFLGDNRHALLVEIKVAPAGARPTKYMKGQYDKYQRLGKNILEAGLAARCSHLLIVPEANDRFIEQRDKWQGAYQPESGRVDTGLGEMPFFVRTWSELGREFGTLIGSMPDKLRHLPLRDSMDVIVKRAQGGDCV